MTNKEAIERLLPENKNQIEASPSAFHSGKSTTYGIYLYNSALSDTAEKLSKQVVGVEEVVETMYKEQRKWVSNGSVFPATGIAQALTKEFVILKREVE